MQHTAQRADMRQTPWCLSVVLNAVCLKINESYEWISASPSSHLYATHCTERCHASDAMASCSMQCKMNKAYKWSMQCKMNESYTWVLSHARQCAVPSVWYAWGGKRRVSDDMASGCCAHCSVREKNKSYEWVMSHTWQCAIRCVWYEYGGKCLSHVTHMNKSLDFFFPTGVWLLCLVQCVWSK